MAHNSTSRRRIGAALGALGVSVVAAAALVGMAGSAGAHTPKLSAGCTDDGSWLKVKLTQYNDKKDNTVTVTVDGEVLLEEKFGKSFNKEWDGLDPTTEHEVSLVVEAWDDPNNDKGYSYSEDRTIEACVEPEPEPTVPPSTETSAPEETTTTTSSPAPSAPVQETTEPPTTTSVEVEEAALAETGASIAIPLGIGAVLLAGGVGLMIFVRRRGRA